MSHKYLLPATHAQISCSESQSTLDLSNSSYVPASGLKKTPELSTLRLLLAHTGAALTWFLATTDAVMSTSLPTIAADLEAESQYTWVGVAYLLTQTAFQPLYGRIADIVGRIIAIFALGSLLCAVSQVRLRPIWIRNMNRRGGIVSCVWVITAEVVEMRHRAKWSQALSVTWSCSAVTGPLLGELVSALSPVDHNTFYLNLPLCLIGFLILLGALRDVRLDPASDASCSLIRRFDFGGLILFMGGTCCVVVSFSFVTSNGWKWHFQAADGYSPLEAGVQMLPYYLGASLASMPTAWFISWWQKRRRDTSGQNLVISIGFLISALGFALLNSLNEDSRMSFQDVFPFIAGVGMGILAFKSSELGTCTSAFFLVRFTGATVGIVCCLFVSILRPNCYYAYTLKDIQPLSLRADVLPYGVNAVWIVCTPLLGVAFLVSLSMVKRILV
ncbi:major facilitator superfamily domain-containing protein [Lentinula edodes]|nr:major facilitator superfamily domain-containing protein [Lentinula edodes]